MRLERDCIGELPVPDDALYGIHSLRAVRNFPITEERVNPVMIESYLQIKKAAAMANVEAKTLDKQKGAFIVAAVNQLLFSKDYRSRWCRDFNQYECERSCCPLGKPPKWS